MVLINIYIYLDDPFNIFALQKLFECLKLPTIVAYSGIRAVDLLHKEDINHIGLILMDCNMPVMNGLEVFFNHYIYIYIYIDNTPNQENI